MLKTKRVVNSEYHFVRCLGEGLSSTVYEALRSNSSGIQGERVAVKVLKSENSVSWLQNEFESLRRVNSARCVRVLGHEAFEESAALILEYIEGVTLFELGSKFLLSREEISQIGAQVREGLAAIASAGIAHGDLNPKNILLTQTGDLKIIDFGSFAGSAELIGSLPYIPMQIWQRRPASYESDLASWKLIVCDLKTQFASVPFSEEEAKVRALYTSRENEVDDFESPQARETLAAKVRQLLQNNSSSIVTAVLSRQPSYKVAKLKSENRFFAISVASIVFTVLFPAQNLLSEPLKAAESSSESATLFVRTHEWTELTVNGISKGYAPVNLQNLAPGKYRIKYKRPRGAGELTILLNPGQKRLLRDTDFRYTKP